MTHPRKYRAKHARQDPDPQPTVHNWHQPDRIAELKRLTVRQLEKPSRSGEHAPRPADQEDLAVLNQLGAAGWEAFALQHRWVWLRRPVVQP